MLEVWWAKRHLRIRARSATGEVAGHLTTPALSPAHNTGLPTLLHSQRPLSRTAAPYADQAPAYQTRAASGTADAIAFHTG